MESTGTTLDVDEFRERVEAGRATYVGVWGSGRMLFEHGNGDTANHFFSITKSMCALAAVMRMIYSRGPHIGTDIGPLLRDEWGWDIDDESVQLVQFLNHVAPVDSGVCAGAFTATDCYLLATTPLDTIARRTLTHRKLQTAEGRYEHRYDNYGSQAFAHWYERLTDSDANLAEYATRHCNIFRNTACSWPRAGGKTAAYAGIEGSGADLMRIGINLLTSAQERSCLQYIAGHRIHVCGRWLANPKHYPYYLHKCEQRASGPDDESGQLDYSYACGWWIVEIEGCEYMCAIGLMGQILVLDVKHRIAAVRFYSAHLGDMITAAKGGNVNAHQGFLLDFHSAKRALTATAANAAAAEPVSE